MKNAATHFEEGMKAIALSRSADYHSEYIGDLESGVAAFDEALGLEPTHLEALRERGLALALLDRHEAALDSFVAAAAQVKNDPELLLAVAQSLVKLRRHDEALKAFEQVLALSPGDEEARFGRADTLMALGDFENGLRAWDLVLEAPDNKTLALHGRTVRVLTGDFRRTHAHFSRALSLAHLAHPGALAALREVFDSVADQLTGPSKPLAFLDALRTLEVVRTAFRGWIDAHAKEPNTWRRAASTWFEAHRTTESIAAWDRLISLAPDAQAWFGKAEAHVQAGQLSVAIHAYEGSLQLCVVLAHRPKQRCQLFVCHVPRVQRDASGSSEKPAHHHGLAFEGFENSLHRVQADVEQNRQLGWIGFAKQAYGDEDPRSGRTSKEFERPEKHSDPGSTPN